MDTYSIEARSLGVAGIAGHNYWYYATTMGRRWPSCMDWLLTGTPELPSPSDPMSPSIHYERGTTHMMRNMPQA